MSVVLDIDDDDDDDKRDGSSLSCVEQSMSIIGTSGKRKETVTINYYYHQIFKKVKRHICGTSLP